MHITIALIEYKWCTQDNLFITTRLIVPVRTESVLAFSLVYICNRISYLMTSYSSQRTNLDLIPVAVLNLIRTAWRHCSSTIFNGFNRLLCGSPWVYKFEHEVRWASHCFLIKKAGGQYSMQMNALSWIKKNGKQWEAHGIWRHNNYFHGGPETGAYNHMEAENIIFLIKRYEIYHFFGYWGAVRKLILFVDRYQPFFLVGLYLICLPFQLILL